MTDSRWRPGPTSLDPGRAMLDAVASKFRDRLGRLLPASRGGADPDDDPAAIRARADHLVADGRLPDAIAALTALNRRQRDPAVERRLV